MEARLHPTVVSGFIVVDGPIGAGKTTFVRNLRDKLAQRGASVVIIDEIIPEDLVAYYKDPKTNSYPFQCKFVSLLAEQMYKLCKRLESGEIDFVISDRYYASTRGFIEYQKNAGYLTEEQVNDLYGRIKAIFFAIPLVPEFFIFVDEPSATCLERIGIRGREGELAAKTEALIETNDFIRRFNSVPYFGHGPDEYISLEKFGRLYKYLPLPPEIERAVGTVNMIHIYNIAEGTTTGTILPHMSRIDISEILPRGRIFHHLRDQIAKDAILFASTGLCPDDIQAPDRHQNHSEE